MTRVRVKEDGSPMTEDDLMAEYRRCQERGHQPSGWQAMSNPPQNICKWCGTRYRVETGVRELSGPAGGPKVKS